MKTKTTIWVCIGIIIGIIGMYFFIGNFIYDDSTSNSEIQTNSNDISKLKRQFVEIKSDIINLDIHPGVTPGDLAILESELEQFCEDEVENECGCEDGDDGIDGENWNEMQQSEYNCLLVNWGDYSDTMNCFESL